MAGELSAEDRDLLEKHAPYLKYDAQDGYRAVAAATMTAAPCNCLSREQGTVIAGAGSFFPELGLETLTDYPGGLGFEDGDQLAAGPNPLQVAVGMQREAGKFPHCAYGRVLPRGRNIWLQYWLWYYDNPKTFLGRGRHQGDWELIVIRLDRDRRPLNVVCSQHAAGEARPWKRVAKHDGTHPLIYVAPFSHANYFAPGTRFFFPGADHPTAVGPGPVKPDLAEFGAWQEWRGRWGASAGVLMGWRLLRPLVKGRLGGESPAAPIEQKQRWRRPGAYYRRALLRKPVSGLKLALWQLGRMSFPLPPKLTGATLAGTRLSVEYELPRTLLRRSRDLLLTVHGDNERQDMLLSQLVRKAPGSGEEVLALPDPPAAAGLGEDRVVYASAFNRLGQRSTPVPVIAKPTPAPTEA